MSRLILLNSGLLGMVTNPKAVGLPQEQQETGQYLIRALDEDRLSDRKLFPLR